VTTKLIITAIILFAQLETIGQKKVVFKKVPLDSLGIKTYEVFPTIEGAALITSSIGLWRMKGSNLTSPEFTNGVITDEKGRPQFQNIKLRSFTAEDSIRSVAQGKDSTVYFVTHDNRFLIRFNGTSGGFGWAPFNFPKARSVTRIWIDGESNLFVGTLDNFYFIKKAARKQSFWGVEFDGDKDSNLIVTKGALPVEQIIISPGTIINSFAQDAKDKDLVWVGTNKGLYSYNKKTRQTLPAIPGNDANYTVTEIDTGEAEKIWFSTLEKGMGVFNVKNKSLQFYTWLRSQGDTTSVFPIKTFCYKSPQQFFVAIMDSTPAVFSTKNGSYLFFTDSVLNLSSNHTTDIKVDRLGNLLLVKGGVMYISDVSKSDLLKTVVIKDSSLLAPFIISIARISGEEIAGLSYNPESLHRLQLKHDQNSIIVYYGVNDFAEKRDIQYAWRMQGYTNGWIELNRSNIDEFNFVALQDLKPGKHFLQVRVKIGKENWRSQMAELEIIITPPYWQTWWFWLVVLATAGLGAYFLFKWRIDGVRRFEREKVNHETALLELEARSLRAQMNPHFIFNCLNSIKALIQSDEKQMATDYLTTFSKLIRTVFQNSDKRQISLYDEMDTCQLYTKLESMRLNGKLNYSFNIDPELDLKSVMVPSLIIQPFIENAIWHGIVPKENGGSVTVNIKGSHESVVCIVEDDGIGRKRSRLNKPETDLIYESKGVHLSQARLNLEKLLNDKSATIDTIDLYEDDKAVGTRVTLTFNLQ